jgi:hypothetical protein
MIIFQWPVDGPITQRFGANPLSYKAFGLAGHNGLDLGVLEGTPVKAAAAGTVNRACMDGSGYGNHVRIDHGKDSVTLYGHLSTMKVKVGQEVKAGQVIGLSGNTGNSTGPHLHFEIRMPGGPEGYGGAVDPLLVLAKAATKLPKKPVLYQVKVAARAGVNLRDQPGIWGKIVGSAVYESVLDVYAEKDDPANAAGWVKVEAEREMWACVVMENNFLLLKVIDKPQSWEEALDAWARAKGFDGPKLEGRI